MFDLKFGLDIELYPCVEILKSTGLRLGQNVAHIMFAARTSVGSSRSSQTKRGPKGGSYMREILWDQMERSATQGGHVGDRRETKR